MPGAYHDIAQCFQSQQHPFGSSNHNLSYSARWTIVRAVNLPDETLDCMVTLLCSQSEMNSAMQKAKNRSAEGSNSRPSKRNPKVTEQNATTWGKGDAKASVSSIQGREPVKGQESRCFSLPTKTNDICMPEACFCIQLINIQSCHVPIRKNGLASLPT